MNNGFLGPNDLKPPGEKKKVSHGPPVLIPAKEAQVLQGVMEGKPIVEAVKEAGYKFNDNNARAFGKHLVDKYKDCNGGLLEAFDEIGVDLRFIAMKAKEGLNAVKQIPVKRKKVKGKDFEDEEIEYEDVPDHHARHKHLETMLDILPGARAPKKVEITQTTFEQKAVLVADVRDNPQAAMQVIQRLLEQKKTTVEEKT